MSGGWVWWDNLVKRGGRFVLCGIANKRKSGDTWLACPLQITIMIVLLLVWRHVDRIPAPSVYP